MDSTKEYFGAWPWMCLAPCRRRQSEVFVSSVSFFIGTGWWFPKGWVGVVELKLRWRERIGAVPSCGSGRDDRRRRDLAQSCAGCGQLPDVAPDRRGGRCALLRGRGGAAPDSRRPKRRHHFAGTGRIAVRTRSPGRRAAPGRAESIRRHRPPAHARILRGRLRAAGKPGRILQRARGGGLRRARGDVPRGATTPVADPVRHVLHLEQL